MGVGILKGMKLFPCGIIDILAFPANQQFDQRAVIVW